MNINLTQKERTLLEDLKNHEEICIEKYTKYAQQANDTQLQDICNVNCQVEKSHLDTINQMLSGTIPQMNQQQSQQQNQQSQNAQQSAQRGPGSFDHIGFTDANLCKDLLMTEKYISGTYDTAIFEFKDAQARDLLNHIQKEEQKHGESVFQYMDSKGLYQAQ